MGMMWIVGVGDMMGIEAEPVKLIMAILYRDEDLVESCLDTLQQSFSPMDYRGEPVPFDFTDYYNLEMGSGLKRVLVAFEQLVPPDALPDIKATTRDLERSIARDNRRKVNIDPGYLDLFKLVLASFKARGNKLYLGRGVWGDMTLYFEKGQFHPFQWSFPDFQHGTYHPQLKEIRERYKQQLRACGST